MVSRNSFVLLFRNIYQQFTFLETARPTCFICFLLFKINAVEYRGHVKWCRFIWGICIVQRPNKAVVTG